MSRLTIPERDEAIRASCELCSTGDLDLYTPGEMPATVHKEALYMVQSDTFTGALMKLMLRRGIQTLFAYVVHTNIVEVTTGRLQTVSMHIDSTEEECFQESLVNPYAIEFETLQQIKKLVQYGIDNFNTPEDLTWDEAHK